MRFFTFAALLALLIFFSFSGAYFFYGLRPVSVESESQIQTAAIKVKIERGDGLKEISAVLSQKNLIRSVAVFKTYALLSGLAHRFKPGIYEFDATFSAPEIIAELVAGRAKGVSLIIPEGATLKEIDRLLSATGVLKNGELMNFSGQTELLKFYPFGSASRAWEGFIFPDTYRLSFGSAPADVMRKFLDNFETKAWPLLKNRNDWYEILIKASMLEKEVPEFNDRRLVNGIIDKRLKNKIPLQVDATLVYGKCAGDFLGCQELLLAKNNLGDDSPFNTYKFLGLPPTPISNPGESAIKAALEPKPSSYWYYLSDRKTKKTYFSKTLDEHNNYRAKYIGL